MYYNLTTWQIFACDGRTHSPEGEGDLCNGILLYMYLASILLVSFVSETKFSAMKSPILHLSNK